MKIMLSIILASLLVVGLTLAQENKTNNEEETVQKESTSKISGQCHCGHIKYEAAGPIVRSSYCACRGCQRATGTLKAPFVTFLRKDVTVTTGKLAEFKAKGGEKCDLHGVWQFCPKCGTQIFWKGNKGEELDVFAGTLNDTSLFKIKE